MLVATAAAQSPMQPANQPQQAAPQVPQAGELTVGDLLNQALAYRQQGKQAAEGGNERDASVAFARAMERLAKVIETDATNIEALLQMAEISLLRNDPHQGRKYFKRVTDIETNNFRANLGLGQFYVYSRLWRQAIYHLEIAARVAPEDRLVETLVLLAGSYREASQINDAEETIQRAVRADEQLAGNDPMKLHTNAARIFIEILGLKQDFEGAVRACDILINMTRERAKINTYRSDLLKEFAAAFDTKVDVLTALHNSMHVKDARNQATNVPIPGKEQEIAAVLVAIVNTRKEQIPVITTLSRLEMVPLAKRAVELQPQAEGALATLAQLCIDTNLYGDAQAALQQLVQVNPNNANAQQTLQQVTAVINQARAQQANPQMQPQAQPQMQPAQQP